MRPANDSSLRARVERAVAESPGRAPREVAEAIVADLPDTCLRDALAQTLPNYVRIVMSNGQRPTLQQWDEMCAHSVAGAIPPPLRKMTVFGDGDWKTLDDCAPEDLLAMSARRERLAEGNDAWAVRFRALAEGTSVAPLEPTDDVLPTVQGLAALSVLEAKRDWLLAHLDAGTSPLLNELNRRREALVGLRAVRQMEAEEFARIEEALVAREALHAR